MRRFGLLLHDCRKATLCPPYLVLGLHARARPHHSIGEGQCAEGSTRVENRECCLVRRSWANCCRAASAGGACCRGSPLHYEVVSSPRLVPPASGGAGPSHVERRSPPVPVRTLLVSVAHAQHRRLVEAPPGELEADGQPRGGAPAGHGQRRSAERGERHRQAEPHKARHGFLYIYAE